MGKKKIELYVVSDMKDKLKKESKEKGITLTELIKRIFEEHLK